MLTMGKPCFVKRNTIVKCVSLTCSTTAEKCFVRCSGDVIRNPPAVGAVITVTYEGVWDSGKLKAAQFMREREDLSWIQARTAEAEEPDAPATATIIISK